MAAGCAARSPAWSLVVVTVAAATGCGGGGSPRSGDAVAVIATGETDAIAGDADDPAIWIDGDDPARSVVIGTDKHGGIEVYDLRGARLQRRDDGKLNSVDVRGDVVAASNRSDDTIVIYRIDGDRSLVPVGSIPAELEVYGMCLYRSRDASLYAFVVAKSGEIAQLAIDTAAVPIAGVRVRTLAVPSQGEGCVADDDTGVLYVSEEDAGIWRFDAAADAPPAGTLIAAVDGVRLVADVEGLALYRGAGGAGYLLASSQGDNTYAVYRRDDDAYVGRFRVATADGDRVTHTDGIDVTSAALGTGYPCGLFVAHDTRNEGFTANFKLVSWQVVEAALGVATGERCTGP